MRDNEFDQFFRDQLDDHPSRLPVHLWKNIHIGVARRPSFLLKNWYFIAPVLPVILVVGHFLAHPTGQLKAKHPNQVPQDLQQQQTAQQQPKQQTAQQVQQQTQQQAPYEHPIQHEQQPATSSITTTLHPNITPTSAEPHTQLASYTSATRSSTNIRHHAITHHVEARTSPNHPKNQIQRIHKSTDQEEAAEKEPRSIYILHPVPQPHAPIVINDSQLIAKYSKPKKPDTAPAGSPQRVTARKSIQHTPSITGWFIDASTSPDIPFTPAKQPLSYSTGLQIGKSFNTGFSASIGIQYAHIKLDTLNALRSASSLRRYNIPILGSYQLGSSSFKVTTTAGLVWNINSHPAGFNDSTLRTIYRSNTGISLYLGVGVSRKINDRLSLFASPYFLYHLSDITKPGITPSQRIDIGGLNIGVRYYFINSRQHK